eukprot:RCo027383
MARGSNHWVAVAVVFVVALYYLLGDLFAVSSEEEVTCASLTECGAGRAPAPDRLSRRCQLFPCSPEECCITVVQLGTVPQPVVVEKPLRPDCSTLPSCWPQLD